MIRGPTLTLPVVNLVDKILNLDIGGVVSGPPHHVLQILAVGTSASKSSIRRFVITEKAPTRAFSWLKAATTTFTFKTLLRRYAKKRH